MGNYHIDSYRRPANGYLPPSHELSLEEYQKIFIHNTQLGFIWNDIAKRFVLPGTVIVEKESFIVIEGRRYMKPEAKAKRKNKS